MRKVISIIKWILDPNATYPSGYIPLKYWAHNMKGGFVSYEKIATLRNWIKGTAVNNF